VRANKSFTDTPWAANSAASAANPSRLWVGASRSADNELTVFIVVIVSSTPVILAHLLRAFWHILTSIVTVASANIGSFRPEYWHTLTLLKVRIGGKFQTSTHDELAQPKPEHEPSQRSSGPQ